MRNTLVSRKRNKVLFLYLAASFISFTALSIQFICVERTFDSIGYFQCGSVTQCCSIQTSTCPFVQGEEWSWSSQWEKNAVFTGFITTIMHKRISQGQWGLGPNLESSLEGFPRWGREQRRTWTNNADYCFLSLLWLPLVCSIKTLNPLTFS